MNTYSFTKRDRGWCIVLKNDLKEFNQSDFVLLEGSIPLLNFLSKEKKKVTLALDTAPFEKALKLDLIQMCETPRGGAYYQLSDDTGKVIQEEIWLSDIPLFVFGDIPEHIYLRREASVSIENLF